MDTSNIFSSRTIGMTYPYRPQNYLIRQIIITTFLICLSVLTGCGKAGGKLKQKASFKKSELPKEAVNDKPELTKEIIAVQIDPNAFITTQFKPGGSYLHAIYLDGVGTMVSLEEYNIATDGKWTKTTRKMGRLKNPDGDLTNSNIVWDKNVDIVSYSYQRIKDDYLEEGTHLDEKSEITWEPIFKLPGKVGDKWSADLHGMTKKYHVLDAQKRLEMLYGTKNPYNGKNSLTVSADLELPNRLGTQTTYSVFVQGIGLVEWESRNKNAGGKSKMTALKKLITE